MRRVSLEAIRKLALKSCSQEELAEESYSMMYSRVWLLCVEWIRVV